jgi:CP family cyanate transporter-like MFS transporter
VHVERRRRLHSGLVLAALVGLAFNLRPAAGSIGPVVEEVQGALGMSAATAGLLTALPVLAFSGFGAAAPWLAAQLGVHRLSAGALALTAVGLGVRAAATSELLFLVATVAALAGMATGNVMMPSLVKLHFPHRIGLVTAIYTTVLAGGMTMSTLLTVPVAQATGSWRGGLAVWAVTAALAALPWLALLRHDQRVADRSRAITMRQVMGTPLGRMMALAFGLQSLQAYAVFGWLPQIFRDNGYSAATAGLMLALVTAIGIPLSLAVPTLAARRPSQVWLMLTLLSCYPPGLLGLVLFIDHVPWLWALLIGVSQATFPLILTLLGLRTRTPSGTAALSGFTQAVGYLISAIGPFGMSLLHEATGSWTVPLLVLTALIGPLVWTGVAVARPGFVEDQLGPEEDGQPASADTRSS